MVGRCSYYASVIAPSPTLPPRVSSSVASPPPVREVEPRPARQHVAADAEGDSFRVLFGRLGAVWVATALLGAFVLAAAFPLDDPDLPMHLAIGEWIVRHRALPVVEPFAWTRAGAPFYAYSWLPEVLYFAALRAGGPVALHVVQACVAVCSVLGVWWMARVAGWSRWSSLLVAWLHMVGLLVVALELRPHGFLAVAMPLAWAAAIRLARSMGDEVERPGPLDRVAGPRVWPYVVLWGAAALAANSHLLAPIVAAPLAVLLPGVGRRPRVVVAAAAAVVIGLLTTPYAARWVGIYRLNFAPNALFTYPSHIAEHTPGMVWVARHAWSEWWLMLLILCGVVWLPRRAVRAWEPRADALLTALWLGGLLLFALAAKGMLVWWLVSLPLLGAAAALIPNTSGSVAAQANRALLILAPWLMVGRAVPYLRAMAPYEGTVQRRVMPGTHARAALALADTLDRAAPGRAGRVVTAFAYGSALLWRLPRYSMSIDGRTIFPDSAALMDAYVLGSRSAAVPSPVGAADVALVRLRSRLDVELTRRAGWRRLAVARARVDTAVVDSAALWVRDGWLLGGPDRGRAVP